MKKKYKQGVKEKVKVKLTKNDKHKDHYISQFTEVKEMLTFIQKDRFAEMQVKASSVVPLVQDGGNYGIIFDSLLPKWKEMLNFWIQNKDISKKEKIQFREQLKTCNAAYSGIKIMGPRAFASIAKGGLTDIKDGELRTNAQAIVKSVESGSTQGRTLKITIIIKKMMRMQRTAVIKKYNNYNNNYNKD
eukprot:GHVR01059689.1.p1 GENE.GHVR01059689.1~~GHVR01059689.1.p1  ORF type:complete len:189 (-),score=17.57 GHVR01059689.1:210-776(-)